MVSLVMIGKGFSQESRNFYGSFESNGIYYQDNENEKYNEQFASNNYLNLKYIFNSDWNFEAQVESYSPLRLQGYSDSFEKTHLSTLNINYTKKGFGLTFGSIYEQFGSGLILRTWEDRQLGINNSIWGLRSTYENDNISLKLVGGFQKKGSQISVGKVIGLDSEITVFSSDQIYQNLTVGLSYVGRFENLAVPAIYPPVGYDFNDLTNLFSARIDYEKNDFYIGYEQIHKTKDGIAQFGLILNDFVKKGSAHTMNFGIAKSGFGFDFTFRRLENMGFFSDRFEQGELFGETTINYLPALTKQHDYSLTNINIYESQPYVSFPDPSLMKAGEIGFQVDLYYNIKKDSFVGGKHGANLSLNLSSWYNLDGDYSYNPLNYNTDFLGFGQKYFSEQSIEFRKKWSEKFSNIFLLVNKYYNKRYVQEKIGEINSQVIVVDNTIKLENKKSLRFELQHLFNKDDEKNWYGYGVEYNFNFNFSTYFNNMVNYQSIDDDKPNYYSFGASYTKNSSRFSLSYGKQRGGLLCYGGICRYVPEFKGLSFSINTSF
jgi:hypothetical protein|tara:strand:+ start:1409 stop:3043 length:1635 start_codon:yes stop_codon:yes gene_type:complete